VVIDRAGLWWRILLYNVILHTASLVMLPWVLIQFLIMPKRRVGIRERLGGAPMAKRKPLWVHAVSVGEVRAVSPMVDLLSGELEGRMDIFLSTVTVTGQGTAQRECGQTARIFYFPLDLLLPVKRSLARISPTVFVTTETEIWPNFLYGCFTRRIPVVMVNGRISDRSYSRYRFFRWFFRPFLQNISSFLMQSEEDARRITELGASPDRVHITGNMKYDMVPKPVDLPEGVRNWSAGSFLLVAGSTHEGEEEILLDVLTDEAQSGIRLALVPRHPERFDDVARLIREKNREFVRFSRPADIDRSDATILLVDAMGVLDGFYALADAAFVGGSLVPVGGHNLLEPAMHGKPVITGPHMHNFRDITDALVTARGCKIVKDEGSLAEILTVLVEDAGYRQSMGRSAREASREAAGASAKNAKIILEQLAGTLRTPG
jgi:3-deoxy-D-manno-octulosonic-acid transferase